MTLSPFIAALNQICDEKGLPRDIVVTTVEHALAAAYRKDYGHSRQVIRAKLAEDGDLADVAMFQVFNIVKKSEFEDNHTQILMADAKKIRKDAKIGEEILIPLPHQEDFGRIAAQTAKQVIIQRLREAERDILFQEFKDKEKSVVTGQVQQIETNDIIVNLGKINAIMLPSGQVTTERYYIGQRLKVYVVGVEESTRGPRVLVSRTDAGLIRGLFQNEVPEIAAGTVEIKMIAREAGSRTKMAVVSTQSGLDPVGSCVGQRGVRVTSVLSEVGDEKIDIVLWDSELPKFIANALSPAKVSHVTLSEEQHKAKVVVPEDQTSLAIGKGGQNVRLASKLTGFSIDIEKSSDTPDEQTDDLNEIPLVETVQPILVKEKTPRHPKTPKKAKVKTAKKSPRKYE